jgi:hypothetical protein
MKVFHPRRQLIVNKEVQYDVLMYVGIYVMCIFLAQVFAGFLFLSKLEERTQSGEFASLSVPEFITRYKTVLLVYELIPVLVGGIAGVFIFSRLTSRIVGPLYNVRRVLQKATSEHTEAPEIKLREQDYFQDLIDDINTALKNKKL